MKLPGKFFRTVMAFAVLSPRMNDAHGRADQDYARMLEALLAGIP